MKQFWLTFREIAEVVVISLFTVFVIRNYLMQPFLVSGASMEPNFSNGHYLLIDELSYRFREPKRGEVVVFRYPGDERVYYIKRVIGLPGERVIVKDGRVFVYNPEYPNGFELKENYLASDVATSGNVDTALGDGEYFVMGDNRYFSFDSRNWGTLTRDEIIGVARLRLFPFTQISAFEAPTY
jgi:signal peptidase I